MKLTSANGLNFAHTKIPSLAAYGRGLCRLAMELLIIILALLGSTTVAFAKITILNAEAWLDVHTGELNRPANFVIEDQQIQAINPQCIPEGHVVDLPGYILLPGLIDSHTHLTRDIVPGWREQPVRESEADWALRGARNAALTLRAGFTTVRDVGSYRFADLALMRAIDKGMVPGPQMLACGHIICRTGGHCDFGGYAHGVIVPRVEYGMADGPQEIIKAVRHQIRMGAKVIKVSVGGGATSEGTTLHQPDLAHEELVALVKEAHRHNLRVAAHAHAGASAIAAINAGVDSVEHGYLLTPEAIELMVKKQTWLVPTVAMLRYLGTAGLSANGREKAAEFYLQVSERIRQAIQAGVRIAFGTDAAILPHGRNAEEFEAMTQLGMSNLGALQTATLNAAQLLNLPDRGQLAPGYRADIIGLQGNPMEDITHLKSIQLVMKAGEIHVQP